MKIRKACLKISLIIIAIMMMATTSFAATVENMGIVSYRKPNAQGAQYKYTFGGGKTVFDLVKYNNGDTTNPDYDHTIYCLKAETGFFAENAEGTFEPVEYNQQADFKDKSSMSVLPVPETYYNHILWILDNIYMPTSQTAEADKENLMKAAGITNSRLTDDDIDVVQQMALWFFTNAEDAETKDQYHVISPTTGRPVLTQLHLSERVNGIDTTSDSLFSIDDTRNDQAVELYQYFIDSANANAATYNPAAVVPPVSLSETVPTIEVVNSNYIAGPYKINKDSDMPFTLEYTENGTTYKTGFVDENGNEITNYKLLDENKNEITDKTIEDLVGTTFYVSVPKSSGVQKIGFKLYAQYTVTSCTYWTKGGNSVVQPLVEVKKNPEKIIDENIVAIPAEKPFDLALRKFISQVNEETINRAPTPDVSKLASGDATSATYIHSKVPVKVKKGDIVIYTIRIYNEGEVDGYAEQVTDFLPPELEFVNDEFNAGYRWVIDGTNTRKITTDYLSKDREKTEGENLIKAFDGTTLDYIDIQVKCKVKETAGKNKITNIAAITDDADSQGNEVVDRDSDPEKNPTPTDTELPGYKDDETNNDPDNVPGQEDDDDFEKILIEEFDLSLRKYITEINGIEYIGRTPKITVTNLANNTQSTAIYEHPKKPISLQRGDVITYTIAVYNEGDVDGYVNEITDHLPPELEYLPDDELNKQYEWQISEDGRTVTTDYLSKAKETSDRDNLLEAFDGEELDVKEVKIRCKVKDTAELGKKITNIAEITEHEDDSGNTAVKDRDSSPEEFTKPEDTELPGYKDDESDKPYVPGQQDDDDFEKVKVVALDFALRKHITEINEIDYSIRAPKITLTDLANGNDTTATYDHPKNPINVKIGDIVTYTISVYNEGDIDGYVAEITDHLPPELEYLPDDELNKQYEWKISEDGRVATTDYLSKAKETSTRKNLLEAFDGTTLDTNEVKIRCKVKNGSEYGKKLTNIAEITMHEDYSGKRAIIDRDSSPEEFTKPEDPDVPVYKDEEINKAYVPGQQDDDDFEKIRIAYFDLALRKFITGVNDTEITDRIPQLSIGEDGNIRYDHTKDPVLVENGNIVTYTLRIYNEGELAGYASEVTDDVPDGLEFLPEHETNIEYRWNLREDGKVATDYLSKEQETTPGENLIKAFDKEKGIIEGNPDYRDIKIAFKVTEPNTSDRILVNTAEISDDRDENNDPVEDADSVPGNDNEWNEEDDLDKDFIEVKYFDLSLKKWVSKTIVIENGKETVTETGHTGDENPEPIVKVDLHRKKIEDVIVKFEFQIKVTNEGQIAGYAKEVTDYVPEGLKFVQEDNKQWYIRDNNERKVGTRALEDVLLQPGESASVPIILTWINGQNNIGLKTNIAEISEDYNDSNTPDIDSVPDNEVEGEDDIDDAPVMLAIELGEGRIYFLLGTVVSVTLLVGIILIKRYVL